METTKNHGVVLVVEDEALLRMQAVDILEEAGYTVLEASDADQAIVLLETRNDIRVLFTDINIPGSMDGLKLATAVRDRWPPVKILVTSGLVKPGAGAIPLGGKFVPKPYVPAEIVATVQQLLS